MEVLFYFGIESKLVSRECLFSGLEGSDPGQLFIRRKSCAGGRARKGFAPEVGGEGLHLLCQQAQGEAGGAAEEHH